MLLCWFYDDVCNMTAGSLPVNFDELFANVCDALRRERRISYRALRRRFELSDEDLEDLTEELIHAKKWAVDEDSRVLVWTGETGEVPEPTSQPEQTTQPDTQAQSKQVEPPPTETRAPDAERRQLTVMFCDLVESTALSGRLDPEDLREIVREYQRVCSEVIQRYDGHVAQLLGDGLLVYFGYPQAHEDDAQRAVRSGLGIIEAIGALNSRLEHDQVMTLSVRLGIHTGLVVVGDMGGSGRQEQLALGETPNVAARIQSMAEPDTVVISDATHRLVQGSFVCHELGEQHLRGVSQSIRIYQVFRESGVQSRLDIVSRHGLTPLVGREQEVGLLLERWAQAKEGQGQVVLLSGEAGIGKSRLLQVLKDHVADEPHTPLECRSSPYFTNSALYPIIDMIQRTLRFQTDDTPEQKLEKLTHNLSHYRLPVEETVPLFAALLSLPVSEDQYPPLNLSPQRQRQKTLESIVTIILELAEQQPVLFILEDLHWTDPSTLEFIELLIDQTPTVSICILLTCRPEYQPTWSHRSYLTEMTLNRLSRQQVEQVATQVSGGKTLPAEVLEQLVDRTDGVPLYIEEMTKSVLESGALKEVDGQYELMGSISTLSIPTTLQDSLMSRLDRLVTAKAVAQYASVIGRQFSYELLQAVSELDEAMLQHELRRLVEAELVYQRGLPPQSTYIFKHALIQDAAYQSLLRRTRQGYHRRIAEVLETQFPETVEMQPELLAHHFTEAGMNEQAVGYWQKAGEKSVQCSAHQEAITHLNQGLAMLTTLPETPERLQQELDLQVALGSALIATQGQGVPDVERAYARARELYEQIGDTPQIFPVLRGLILFYQAQGQTQTAYRLGEQMLRLAQSQRDPMCLLLAHHSLGASLAWRGEPDAAQAHHTQALAIYTPQEHRALDLRYGMDLGVASGSYLALELWQLGYPDQAMQRSQDTRKLAQEVSHPHSLAQAMFYAAYLHQFRREARSAHEQAEAAVTLATEQGFALWSAGGKVLHGWGLAMQGQSETGIAEMRQGLAAALATGGKMIQLYALGLLAEAYGKSGQPDKGLDALDEALAVMDTTEARFYEAELHRLNGELLLQQSPDDTTEAESCFQQAISIAQNQSAKSWELRAATSLAKLWKSQGKRDEARELLSPVYEWFTEGFDTADLIDAKTLLDELT